MHTFSVLLGLVAAVSAVDIYGYASDEKCGGGYIVCTGVNPNACCPWSGPGGVYQSIGMRAIPSDWNIIATAFNGGDCTDPLFTIQSAGRDNICLGGNHYSGGSYDFPVSGRSEEPPRNCTPARADTMVTDNGVQYNLTSMEDGNYLELVSIPSP